MAKIKPKISVLILTFNQAQFIQRALQSVTEQQSTNYDLEIIVTDDGSSDGTVDVIERFVKTSTIPITVLANKHEGVSAIAKNLLTMINRANGDFIAFLAGDDSFCENRFSLQLEKFFANPNLKISYSDGINCIDGEFGQRCHSRETVELMKNRNAEKVYNHLTSRTPVLFIQGVLAKTDFLKSIQPFDIDLIADDWVFNIKVFNALIKDDNGFDFESNICFIRNLHGDNTSRNLIVHYRRISEVAKRYCINPREIRSEFIANAIVSELKRRNWKSVLYFSKKVIPYPEASFRILKVIFSSMIAKF